MTGYWLVHYKDKTTLSQKDSKNPLYVGDEKDGEVPFRVIDWANVESLVFESSLVRSTFLVQQPPEGYQLSLRRRTFQAAFKGSKSIAYLLIVSRVGEEINDDTVTNVLYWLPNGISHACPHFNCSQVAEYVTGRLHGKPLSGVSELTDIKQFETNAVLNHNTE